MRLLLAEDDTLLADGLLLVLRDNGYHVDLALAGDEAEIALRQQGYDLLILDLGLPKRNGLDILKGLRERGQNLPVIILSARDRLQDRVTGLDLGANDYLTKPFELPELEARIRALLRKDQWENRSKVIFGPITYDIPSRAVRIGGELFELSAGELSLLEVFLQRLGRLISKEQLIRLLSEQDEEMSENAVGITIHRLRKKLELHGMTLRVIRRLGYRLEIKN